MAPCVFIGLIFFIRKVLKRIIFILIFIHTYAHTHIYKVEDELGIVKQEELPVGLLERTSPRSSEGRSSSSRRTPRSPTHSARRYHKRKQREEPWPKGPPDEGVPPVPPGPSTTSSSSPDVLHRERPVCLVRGSIFIEDYIEGTVRTPLFGCC